MSNTIKGRSNMNILGTNEAEAALQGLNVLYKREINVVIKEWFEIAIRALSGKRSTGKIDISGQEVFEGDIVESHLGGQVSVDNIIIKYGVYQAYCPVEKCYIDNVGFYASGRGLPDMPIGPLEDYAKVIGNITDNPELIDWQN